MADCVFPGSFDPVTKGHMDLITRAASLFDSVTVTVMVNIHKMGSVPAELRIRLLQKACADLRNVRIDRWDGLLADYMRDRKNSVVVRGLRSSGEYEHEMESHLAGKLLYSQYETVFFPTNPLYAGISSSAVREIAAFGGDITDFVPEGLAEEIGRVLSNR